MLIYVRAKLRSTKRLVQKTSEHHYTVMVPEEPKAGKANEAIIEVLAKYFNVGESKVILEAGQTSHNKVFEILG